MLHRGAFIDVIQQAYGMSSPEYHHGNKIAIKKQR